MAQIRTMLVSERLEMRLHGSPEPENDKGYTMYPNWQLRMEIGDAKALESELKQLKEDCVPFQAQIDQRKTYREASELEEKNDHL